MKKIIIFILITSLSLFEEVSATTSARDHLSGLSDLSSLDPKMVTLAKEALGSPYEYGAIWNGKGSSTDCSGLVHGLLSRLGIASPRTSSEFLLNAMIESTPTTLAHVRPLDVLIFESGSSSSGLHVGLFLGDGNVLHVRKTGTFVEVFNLMNENDSQGQYWRSKLRAVYRPNFRRES